MQLTLESLQSLLTDLTTIMTLFCGVVAVSIFLLAARAFPFHHEYGWPQSVLSSIVAIGRALTRYIGFRNLAALLEPRIYIKYGVAVAQIGSDYGLTLPIMQAMSSNLLLPLVGLRSGLWSSSKTYGINDNNGCRFYASVSTECDLDSICLRKATEDSTLVSGLVNTGNSCYLNSVLQVLSSLPRFHEYLEGVHRIPSVHPRPVTRSLLKTLRLLTRPVYKRASFRPKEVVASDRRFASRDQQDAQELFQFITSAIDTEIEKAKWTAPATLGGLKDILTSSMRQDKSQSIFSLFSNPNPDDKLENPFTGLLANRLSCMQCGYTEAIRHFSFNNVQLTLPDTYSTTLEDCLQEFVAMEYLSDAACRKCSIIETARTMSTQVEALKEHAKCTKDRAQRRQILSEMVALEKQRRVLEHRLNVGDVEDDKDDKSILRTVSRLSSKQAMFAKLPKILCLHLSRSTFHPSGAIYKNSCHINFPEYLDLTPYCTNGTLHTEPHLPISTSTNEHNYQYRLMGTIVHYGSHDFGHFIAYKRRVAASECSCKQCRESSNSNDALKTSLNSDDIWYRISDEQVDMCTIDEVLRENAYMLLYEAIPQHEERMDTEKISANQDSMAQTEESLLSLCSEGSIEALRIANTLLSDDRRREPPTDELPAASSDTNPLVYMSRRKQSLLEGWPDDTRRQSAPVY